MATIGTFTKRENGGYDGTIETLTLHTRATFELQEKRGDTSPDFRIVSGLADLGAAWQKKTKGDGHPYLSVHLDDPSFPAPIDCRLVESKSGQGYRLIWERKRR